MDKPMHMMGSKPDSKPMVFRCEQCNAEQPVPKHCGRDMIPRDGKLVCWMNLPKSEGGLGMKCGEVPHPHHHERLMKLVPK